MGHDNRDMRIKVNNPSLQNLFFTIEINFESIVLYYILRSMEVNGKYIHKSPLSALEMLSTLAEE